MDTVLHQPGGMLTEIPALLTSHHYGSPHSFPELRWKIRQLPIHRSRPVPEEPDSTSDPQENPNEPLASPPTPPLPQSPPESASDQQEAREELQTSPQVPPESPSDSVPEPQEVLNVLESSPSPPQPPSDSTSTTTKQTRLQDLPEEIQQGILDSLMGNLSSTSSSAVVHNQGMRNWSTAMRHPRGRHLSDLGLVSKEWRRMIQERLYRHGRLF